MNLADSIRNKMRSFLQITESGTVTSLQVNATMNHETEVGLNQILYRGDPYEIEQAFKSLDTGLGTFWSSVPSRGHKIRKISTRMYPSAIDRHADILIGGMNKPEFTDVNDEAVFDEIFSDVNEQSFPDLIKKLDTEVLVTGDAAIKITIDTTVSQYPILEIVDAAHFEPKYTRNKLTEIVFYTEYSVNKRKYTLEETYGKGYINYHLYNQDGKEVDMITVPELEDVQDITFAGDYIMAIYCKYWDSPKYEHRGRNLINNYDAVDALDEIVSQWQDAVRRGRVNKYIPGNMIPRDKEGKLLSPNPFDNDFYALASGGQEGNSKIEVEQPNIQYQALETSYINRLQDFLMCAGMSPSTMGIDAKKYDDNATAQREREKITGWTRSQRVDVLTIVIPKIINIVLMTYDNMMGHTIGEHESFASFDEFASPNFEETIEVLAKAAPGTTLLSTETIVDMIGNALNKDDEWKAAEVARLKEAESMSTAPADEAPLVDSDFNY